MTERRAWGHITIAPGIAFETVSPTARVSQSEEESLEYRSAGIKLVWMVHPEQRMVVVHRPDGSMTRLFESDRLSGETVLPELAVKVSDLLPTA